MNIQTNRQRRTTARESGYVVLILAILFAAIGLALVLGGAVPIIAHMASTQGYGYSKQAFLASNSAVNEAYYRLANSKPTPSTIALTVGSSTASISVVTEPYGKELVASSTDASYVRNLVADLSYSTGIAFNYGLQAGNGGINMGGGSRINGNIYSNGIVDAVSAAITGTAVSADSNALSADQTNSAPATPPSAITFRNASASADLAQSFVAGTTTALSKISVYIEKVGSPTNATVYVVADNGGSPSTTQLPVGTVTLNSASVGTSYSWVDLPMQTEAALVAGKTYWFVLHDSSTSGSNYYVIGANTNYPSGTAKTGAYGGTWTTTSLDAYFITYTGGWNGFIGGASYVGGVTIGQGGVGDAWANTVQGASVSGNLYCSTGTHNNKSCSSSKGDPDPISMPYTDADIQGWKSDAQSGGTITGDEHVNWAGATLGPKEITGNLLVDGGGTLTMTGTLYVHGTVTVTGGGKIVLPANFGKSSATIISDGPMTINGGGSAGSGDSASFLFLVTTSDCPYDASCGGSDAIHVSGGAGAVAVSAQNGSVLLDGGASFDAAVAQNLILSGGATVTYNSGLASPTFQSGPSGGFTLLDWKEY